MTLVGAALGLSATVVLPGPAWAEALGVTWLGPADAAVVQSILEYEVTGVVRALPESGASFTITQTDLSDGICRSFVVEQAESVAEGIACRAASGGWSAQGTEAAGLSAARPAAGATPVPTDSLALSPGSDGSLVPNEGPRQVQVARDPETGEVRTVISQSGAGSTGEELPELADWEVLVTTVIPPPLPARHPMRQSESPRAIGLADLVEHAVPAVGGSVEPLVPAPPLPPGQ